MASAEHSPGRQFEYIAGVQLPAQAPRRVPRRFRGVEEPFVGANSLRLLRDGREAFPAMLDAIEAAEHQVLLEFYWFDSDRIGRRFADALTRALERGVDVAVIYDAIGSITASREMFDALERSGARVTEYNPIAPWRRRFRLDRVTRRDHRKMLIVDGRVGFTGGINIADQWQPLEEQGGGWRDDMVRIEGPAVAGLSECFAGVWREQYGSEVDATALGERHRHPLGSQRVRVLAEAYFRARRQISRAYLSHLYRAARRAWLASSYFLPDPSVLRALVAAARRGVDVRVLLPGTSDVEFVRYGSRAVWERLLRRGVRIFEWQDGILHSKSAVIDGVWSTIGTFNLDYLSLRQNLEVNVSVLDARFGATLEASFARDFELSREVDRRAFQARPWTERVLETIFYRLRKFL